MVRVKKLPIPYELCGLEEVQFKKYNKQLKQLLKLPLVKQKTEEWYAMRHNMITASDFAQALGHGKFGNQNDLILKKCEATTGDSKAFSANNPFFRWGNLFEPVACDLYSLMHGGIKIHEFGLLQHHKYSFFGASPDGISDAGIMLEIKCPFKRKIIPGGDVPKQYYYQIQGQLDVCKLDICDYFECEFEKQNVEEMDEDVNIKRWRGVLIDPFNSDDEVAYGPIFSPESKCSDLLKAWVEDKLTKTEIDGTPLYWSLAVYNQKRVYRDVPWVAERLKDLEVIWNKILYYRQNPDKIQMDIGKSLNIDTEVAFSSNTTAVVKNDMGYKKKESGNLIGYSFRDIDSE